MNGKYQEHIELNELRTRPETYLEFGSLFGTLRLQLHESKLVWLRQIIFTSYSWYESSSKTIISVFIYAKEMSPCKKFPVKPLLKSNQL